jgi:hypothetical protein
MRYYARDFDDEPTVRIPRASLREVIYGEGHEPVGPERPTRDLRAVDATIIEDHSDGIPLPIEGFDSTAELFPLSEVA